jgi:hypothetical protein
MEGTAEMAQKRKQGRSNQERRAVEAADQAVLERVQELTWAMLDEQISDDEFRLLENLLLSDDEARETYVNCIQLHAGLMEHLTPPTTPAAATGSKSPVLGLLDTGAPGFQSQAEAL